jgi:hypothetical protein
MFCPLCQAEYREGFVQCSDCHIALTASFQDAQSSAALLWDGYKQSTLDMVLTALEDLGVPSHFNEIKEPPLKSPWGLGLQRLLPFPLRLLWMQSISHYEVWVLRKDLEKARSAIAKILLGTTQ